MTVPAGTSSKPTRKLLLVVAAGAALAVLTVGVLVLWLRGEASRKADARATSSAAAHLAAGCELVIRIDLRRALRIEALRKHLEPAMKKVGPGPAGDVIRAAGIDPARDVADVAVCMAGEPGKPRLAFVIGGDLHPDAVVPALVRSETAAPPSTIEVEGRPVAKKIEPNGETSFVGQAADGAIVISNDEVLLASALAASDRSGTYGLAAGPELAFAAGPAMFRLIAERGTPGLSTLGAARGAVGSVGLAEGRATIRVRAPDAPATGALAAELGRVTEELRSSPRARIGPLALFEDPKVEVRGDEAVVEARVSAGALEALAELLASRLGHGP